MTPTTPTTTPVAPSSWWLDRPIYEFNEQQYTRTNSFKEFANYLPQLKALGVGIVWFMPIFPRGPSGSFYAPTDFQSVDPTYGSFDDFKALLEKIHSMGMYAIIDFVPNHMAWTSSWIKEHPDWFVHDRHGNIISGSPAWTDVAKIDWSNPALVAEMTSIWKYWAGQAGVDGFRFDYAVSVPPEVYSDAREALNKIKSVFFLCEGSDSDNSLLAPYCDMTYAWDLPNIFGDIAHGTRSAGAIDGYLSWETASFSVSHIRMRYTSNHDLGPNIGRSLSNRYGDGVQAFAVLTATLPGKPLVYNGQEIDLATSYAGTKVTEAADFSTNPYRTFYTKLLRLYRAQPALYEGTFSKLTSDQDARVYAFARQSGESRVIVIVNLSSSPVAASVDIGDSAGTYIDVYDGQAAPVPRTLQEIMPAWGYKVLLASS